MERAHTEEIKQKVYNAVVSSEQRLTPIDVKRKIAVETGVDRRVVKVAIKDLINSGELEYTHFGSSFLERSFHKPLRISRRIVIKPPNRMHVPEEGDRDIVIDINLGAAFGNGRHPSTYLILRTLENLFLDQDYFMGVSPIKVLDIGTGTGILAIAAAKLGAHEIIGIDIDRLALAEASGNVEINGLTKQITIASIPLEEIKGFFQLVMVNIGYHTLELLCPLLISKIEENGLLVLSGIKWHESEVLLRTYLGYGLTLLQSEAEHSWVCLVLEK